MKNKLDAFNKDKIKCKKCTNYFDLPQLGETPVFIHDLLLCKNCGKKWEEYWQCKDLLKSGYYKFFNQFFNDFLNEK